MQFARPAPSQPAAPEEPPNVDASHERIAPIAAAGPSETVEPEGLQEAPQLAPVSEQSGPSLYEVAQGGSMPAAPPQAKNWAGTDAMGREGSTAITLQEGEELLASSPFQQADDDGSTPEELGGMQGGKSSRTSVVIREAADLVATSPFQSELPDVEVAAATEGPFVPPPPPRADHPPPPPATPPKQLNPPRTLYTTGYSPTGHSDLAEENDPFAMRLEAAAAQRQSSSDGTLARQVFTHLDKTEDGKITRAEFQAFQNALKKSSKARADRKSGTRKRDGQTPGASSSATYNPLMGSSSTSQFAFSPMEQTLHPSQALHGGSSSSHQLAPSSPKQPRTKSADQTKPQQTPSGAASSSATAAELTGSQPPGRAAELASKIFKDGKVTREQFQAFQKSLYAASQKSREGRQEGAAAADDETEERRRNKSRSPRKSKQSSSQPSGAPLEARPTLAAAGALGAGSDSLTRHRRQSEDSDHDALE